MTAPEIAFPFTCCYLLYDTHCYGGYWIEFIFTSGGLKIPWQDAERDSELHRIRKIRCSFVTGSATCSPCLGRGSRCVDQQERMFEPFQEPRLHQVSPKVEQRVQLLRSLRSTGDQSSDIGLPVSGEADRAPLVSFLNTTEQTSHYSPGAEHKSGSETFQELTGSMNTSNPKTASVCETLRSALPTYDIIMSTLSKNGAWWISFRQKCHAIYGAPVESLLAFAARIYTSSNPTELGTLVAAYARSTNHNNHLYALVDSLIISDLTYSATLDGLECLILLAKSYTDIGQPRRAWFVWRKGMTVAQLMGLYHTSAAPAKHQMIWWAIYHGDRFTSLLLGLPYGFNDVYYTDTMEPSLKGAGPPEHQLILQCAIISGKIIDRNIAHNKPSFPKTIDLYHQMEMIAACMPDDWWGIPDEPPALGSELSPLVDRLLQQFFFFHVKLYLHLPFLAKSTASPAYAISGLACMDASRQLLRIFLMLQTKVDGALLFECKTTNFIALMAAVVLLLRIDSTSDLSNARNNHSDRSLIESTWRVFRNEEEEKDCKLASQCKLTLGMLADIPEKHVYEKDSHDKFQEIRIPYFGTIVRKRVKQASGLSVTGAADSHHSDHHPPLVSNPSLLIEDYTWLDEHEIEYIGQDFEFPTSWGLVGTDNLQSENQSSTLGLSMMDIDQDWGIFPDM
ncbi:hypothetical protein VTL71DRAFT_12249 [Oculimacula yallundae]|uniref:Xylanolytic transcriptional activator regulatory domain-containing protein n=1 Tax=Oculimacula yallundae TaxID=86028 RepID=A0ABR4CU05_9HELO